MNFTKLEEIANRYDIRLKNLKTEDFSGGKYDTNIDCYIGRKNTFRGFYSDSVFHNPFVLEKESQRAEILAKYEEYARGNKNIIEALPLLIGKDLWCWCSPKTCHGEVLIKMLDEYYPHLAIKNWLHVETAIPEANLEKLKSQVSWNTEAKLPDGKTQTLPRLMAYEAKVATEYKYANLSIEGSVFTPHVKELLHLVESLTGLKSNSVLLNYYRDGNDKIGWHSDKEKQLGENPIIITLNVGESRDFSFRLIEDHKVNHKITLKHGDVLIMDSECQRKWQHAILPESNKKERISLTFRNIIPNSLF
jgi:alkylated DNA repair dioxygenase AlkB